MAFSFFFGLDDQQADHAGNHAETADDQREEYPGDILGSHVSDDTEDHGADVFGGGGFEEVGATAGAVADVVADEVGDDGGVAGVVFRDAGLNFADEVGAHISGLGIDTAAELGEEGDKAGAEAEADDKMRGNFGCGSSAEGEEDNGNTDEAQSGDKETGYSAAAQGDVDGLGQALLGSGGAADVGFNGNVHADEAGEAGADSADQESDAGAPDDADLADITGGVIAGQQADDDADDDGDND